MARSNRVVKGFLLALLAFVAIPRVVLAAPLLNYENGATQINVGSERSLLSIIDEIMLSDGISLQRVSDVNDGLWSLFGQGRVSSVLARARFAGNNNVFGVLPGIDSGLVGFQGLLGSLGRNGVVGNSGSAMVFPDLIGDFRLAIRTPTGDIWSSVASDNLDAMDHMVTWVNVSDPYHYYVAFEDLRIPGADRDYNDFVLELRNVIDGPVGVPEPGVLALIGFGMVALGFARQRKASAHG